MDDYDPQHYCVCGLPIGSAAAEVRRLEGIGDRTVWEILPEDFDEDDPNDSEDCCLMCYGCGRIYDLFDDERARAFVWKQIDRVDPKTMSSITESFDGYQDVPRYFKTIPPYSFRYLGARYKMSFETVESHEIEEDGILTGILLLLKRLDLTQKTPGPFYNIAVFAVIEGIGGRTEIDWHKADISLSKNEHTIREWMNGMLVHNMDAWYLGQDGKNITLVPMDTLPPLAESLEDVPWEITDNGAQDGVVRVWRILRHFEDDCGIFILADRRDTNDERWRGGQIGLFPRIEGIGNRSEIDWSHVKWGIAGYSVEIERRYERIRDMMMQDPGIKAATKEVWCNIPDTSVEAQSFRKTNDGSIVENAEEATKAGGKGWHYCVCGSDASRWISVQPSTGIGNRDIWEPLPDGIHGNAWACPCGRIYAWVMQQGEYGYKLLAIDRILDDGEFTEPG